MPGLIDLTGKRFGHLVVIGPAPRFERGLRWFVRCDCGGMPYSVRGDSLRKRGVSQCSACAEKLCAEKGRAMSTRLPSGKTLVQVAATSGVSLNTVTQRWIRGWDERDLGLPVVGKMGRKQRAAVAQEAW